MSLRQSLNELVNQSHAATWSTFDWVRQNAAAYGLERASTWVSPGEPAFVSNLVEHPFRLHRLSQIIQEHLGPIGKSIGLPLVSGVFIHQKPKVMFGRSKAKVELGDLLLVRQHFTSGKASPDSRAFLVQAKASATPQTGNLTARNELHQFALYSNWRTPFRFPNGELGEPPNGRHWDFSKSAMPDLDSSGVYAIVAKTRPDRIDKAFPESSSWAVGHASPVLTGQAPNVSAGLSLGAALEGLLVGGYGRRWSSPASEDDHWSTFVERCLECALEWDNYPIKRLNATSLPRRRDALAFAEAFATGPGQLAPPVMNADDRHEYFEFMFLSSARQGMSNAFRQAAKKWRASVMTTGTTEGTESAGDGGDGRPPSLEALAAGAPGGPSVLYIATFGEDSSVPPPTPSPMHPSDHPDYGSW